MTHTLPKRIVRTTSPPHAPESLIRRFDSHHDVAELAATLRALAVRAYHAVRDTGEANDDVVLQELHELKDAINRLQADLTTRKLDRLVPYVTALNQQVEAKLG